MGSAIGGGQGCRVCPWQPVCPLSANLACHLAQDVPRLCLELLQGTHTHTYSWAIPPVRLGLSGRNSGKIPEKTPETLSERFLEFPSRVRLGCPKPYNSRHLRLPERFQNSLPPSTAGDASFLRIGSGEGLSELVMEFPAVLGAFLNISGVAPANQTKERSVHELFAGAFRNKSSM